MNYLPFSTGTTLSLGVNAPQQSGCQQVSNIVSLLSQSFPQSFPHPLKALYRFCFGKIDSDIHFLTDSITNTKIIYD